jgi:hypothetical protein
MDTERPDPNIRKLYHKKIKVLCPKCNNIHEYLILVQGITGVRFYASRAIDCDHHCKTCGYPLEPIGYVPDKEEANLKRIESDIRKQKKGLVKERLFVM